MIKERRRTMDRVVTLSIAGILGACVTTAPADYVGLDYEMTDSIPGNATWRIYATFDDAGDQLNSVFGDTSHALTINAGETQGFYQHPLGGPMGSDINPALFSSFPSLEFDSWVTIGREDMVDNTMAAVGIDWTPFEDWGGDIFTDNGAWWSMPGSPQAFAGSELRVLIAQLTTIGVDLRSVDGVINLQGVDAAGDSWTSLDVQLGIPAPGALALLGLAALTVRRRRN
jgi:MYXO-CTERM domain-containing protein